LSTHLAAGVVNHVSGIPQAARLQGLFEIYGANRRFGADIADLFNRSLTTARANRGSPAGPVPEVSL
jgi:uncharacterized protein YhdP